jgi:hypothetical protein
MYIYRLAAVNSLEFRDEVARGALALTVGHLLTPDLGDSV